MIYYPLYRIPLTDGETNAGEKRKVIVFLNKILELFKHCHLCFAKDPALLLRQVGTMITVTSTCNKCRKMFTWESQPYMLGNFPVGDLLLSFAVLCAGGSIRKTLLIFKHMGICAYHESSYYNHQRHLLIPSIVTFWRAYQAEMFKTVQGREVILAGDARHDSMGHSTKFGTYTLFCCTVGLILHLVVVQVRLTMSLIFFYKNGIFSRQF